MISRIYIDNFKSLVDFELNLQELSLVLGSNGTGKTAVFDVVFSLRQLLSGASSLPCQNASNVVFDSSSLTRWQQRTVQVIELDVTLDKNNYRYRLEIEHDPANLKARIALESLTLHGQPLFSFKNGQVQLYRDNHSPGPKFGSDWSVSALAKVSPRNDNVLLTRFLDFVQKVIVCRICPETFLTNSHTEDDTLQRDGRNFAAWYRHMQQERPDIVPNINETLKCEISNFRDIRMKKVGPQTRAFKVAFEQFGQEYELCLGELSNGQKMIIVLYALVHFGHTLFLDDLGNCVDVSKIQPWLIELRDACGDKLSQAVISSHHPEVIDYLGDCAVVLKQETIGNTKANPVGEMKSGLNLSEQFSRDW